jgi:uncharacterized membrane protein
VPGGRAGAGAPSVQRDPGRLVAFSDGVFAITVTLLVLEISPPEDFTNLLHGFVVLWPSYLAYAVTFLFIGQVWANHHVMFDHIRAADRAVLLLNTVLLMIVAFLPFATSVLAGALRSGHGQRTAVAFYGIAFAVTALTFNAVWQYARRHGLLSDALDAEGAAAIGRRFQLAVAWLGAGVGARRPAARPGRGRDRRVQPLLLAADPGREPTPARAGVRHPLPVQPRGGRSAATSRTNLAQAGALPRRKSLRCVFTPTARVTTSAASGAASPCSRRRAC